MRNHIDPETGMTPDDLLDTVGDLQSDVAVFRYRLSVAEKERDEARRALAGEKANRDAELRARIETFIGRHRFAFIGDMADELRALAGVPTETEAEAPPSPPAESVPRKMTCPHGVDTMILCGDCWAGRSAPAAPEVDLAEIERLASSFGDAVDAVGPIRLWMDDADATATLASLLSAVRSLVERARREGIEDARRLVNARKQSKAIARDRAGASGRDGVASHRQSDVETCEEIEAALRALTPAGPGAADEEG